MRPATPLPTFKPRVAAWLVIAGAALLVARLAGGEAVSARCVSAAKSMSVVTPQGVSSVGRELERIAPSGRWELGARGADGARAVTYRAGQGTTVDWEWSCLDEENVPAFTAISKPARALTPERSFE